MDNVHRLAQIIATAIDKANSTVGMAERCIVAGDRVIGESGTYTYDPACPVNLYDGKQVWGVLSESGTMVIVGD